MKIFHSRSPLVEYHVLNRKLRFENPQKSLEVTKIAINGTYGTTKTSSLQFNVINGRINYGFGDSLTCEKKE